MRETCRHISAISKATIKLRDCEALAWNLKIKQSHNCYLVWKYQRVEWKACEITVGGDIKFGKTKILIRNGIRAEYYKTKSYEVNWW